MSNLTVDDLVSREVLCCVSYLISDLQKLTANIGRRTEQELSFDIEDLNDLCETKDYEEPARQKISSMGRDELVEALEDADVEDDRDPATITAALDNVTALMEHDEEGDDGTNFPGLGSEALRDKLLAALDEEEDGWQDFCERRGIDPDYSEVYEHWVVTNWFADKLRGYGQTVVEIANLQIWGRGTTGQHISMDWVIQQIHKDLTED